MDTKLESGAARVEPLSSQDEPRRRSTGAAHGPDLLVTEGGLLHRVLLRIGSDPADHRGIPKAALALAGVAWLPLFALSLAEGPHLGRVSAPFLRDFSTALRFLLGFPALVIAEAYIAPRIARVPRQFVNNGVVRSEDLPRFDAALDRALRLRDATVPQILLPVIAIALSWFGASNQVSSGVTSWHWLMTPDGPQRTWAGAVYDYFSLPLYRFVLLSWVWRYLVWIEFLWGASRLRLRIVPTHPDLSGGLGFIGVGQGSLGILIAVFSVSVAAEIGMQVAYGEAKLPSYYPLVAGYLVLILLVFVAPLLMFAPALAEAKRRGFFEYSLLGARYTEAFERRWIREESSDGELLGTPDLQSLADLANSFNIVRQMRPVPFDRQIITKMAVAAIGPLLPVAALEYPVLKLLGGLAKLVL